MESGHERADCATVVALSETAGFALYGMVDVLGAAGNIWQTLTRSPQTCRLFRVRIVAPQAAQFACGNGIPVVPDAGVADDPGAPIVIVPNDYEWQLHVGTISARMGLSPEQIADTRSAEPAADLWSEGQRAALALADALVHERRVDDALFARSRACFDDVQLIELTQVIGLYTGVAMMVALVQPELDAYAAPLPP